MGYIKIFVPVAYNTMYTDSVSLGWFDSVYFEGCSFININSNCIFKGEHYTNIHAFYCHFDSCNIAQVCDARYISLLFSCFRNLHFIDFPRACCSNLSQSTMANSTYEILCLCNKSSFNNFTNIISYNFLEANISYRYFYVQGIETKIILANFVKSQISLTHFYNCTQFHIEASKKLTLCICSFFRNNIVLNGQVELERCYRDTYCTGISGTLVKEDPIFFQEGYKIYGCNSLYKIVGKSNTCNCINIRPLTIIRRGSMLSLLAVPMKNSN